MIPYLPLDKELYTFHLGHFSIQFPLWGMIFFIAVCTFVFLFINEIKRSKIQTKHMIHSLVHFGFWTILGIHFFHVLFVSRKYCNIASLNSGNDSAGVIFGFIALLIYLVYNKQNVLKYLDAVAVPLMVAAAIIRIGCILVADELAEITSLPWAIYYGNAYRHPIAIYYFLVSIFIVFALYWLKERKLKDGNLFFLGVMIYSSTRILLDFMRANPPRDYFGLSIHQISYIIFFVISLSFFIYLNLAKIKEYLKIRK